MSFFSSLPEREGRIGREGQASQVLTDCEALDVKIYGVMMGNGVAFTQMDWPAPLMAWMRK